MKTFYNAELEKHLRPACLVNWFLKRVNILQLSHLSPQHPRVRYAACNALGQLANDFAPTLQLKHHSKARIPPNNF